MASFIHEDFLLESEAARRLFHDHARPLPIIDYHCHLGAAYIASDHRFRTLTELWLGGDHYKWRAMRANGVPERLITGDAGDYEKFEAWAGTVPYTLRNPLYHWTHLELAFPFEITGLQLGPDTAREIYDRCNERLAEPAFSARGLLTQYRVVVVCTTDDPTDSLEHHLAHRTRGGTRMYPTWRPDAALSIESPSEFNAWVERLGEVTGRTIDSYDRMLEALAERHDFFHRAGCRISDHGLETLYADEGSLSDARAAFSRARAGQAVVGPAAAKYKSRALHELAVMDHERGWVQQYHLGAQRNLSERCLQQIGRDSGFDAIGDPNLGVPLARHLDRLDRTEQLAKTIVYNLNPRDNELVASILGSFNGGGIRGKMQLGSAWWFLDQLDGMRRQLDALSNLGLLSHFVGMLTDSRSFLSYSRHDYFRRLLCNVLGGDIERGLLPRDLRLVGELVERVCYANARAYFDFPDPLPDTGIE